MSDFTSPGFIAAITSAVLSFVTLIIFTHLSDKVFSATRDARRNFIRVFQIPPDGVYNSVEDTVRQKLRSLFLKALSELADLKSMSETHKFFKSDRTQERMNIALVQLGETRAMLREAVETASDWDFLVPAVIDYYLESVNEEI